jgi:hypothetical protein
MSVTDSSLQFGAKLVTNLRDALLYDREGELDIDIDNLILRQNGEAMGDIDMKVSSLMGPTELQSLVPPSSIWRPSAEGLLVEKTWWEFKRSCPLLNYRKNDKLDRFISFYTEYFSVFETTEEGPVVFAFNGADHIAVLNYLKSKLGADLKIEGHDVFCVHVDSDDIAKWMIEKELHVSEEERLRLEAERFKSEEEILRLEAERFKSEEERLRLEEERLRLEEERFKSEEERLRLEEERLRLEEERRMAILNLHKRSPDLLVDDIAGIFGLSVHDVNTIISIL